MIHRLKLLVSKLFLLSLTSAICTAQSSVGGIIVDADEKPMEGASVLLLNFKDSSLAKGSVTTKQGSFVFEHIPANSYLIACSFTGFKDTYSPVFSVSSDKDISLPVIRILEKVANLDKVTVSAKKPLFEQKIDRMVINVMNSITNTGSTALEVLMRSPGITVNQQNNTLSMNGKDGVVVMLNGKINRMPIEAMVQLLGGMSSANIEKIELITTPPTNFDAEGNAGFINIVLKKNTQFGTNGSASVTAGYGIGGGPVTSTGINLNHRIEKWNFYGDYSFARTMPNTEIILYRKVMNGSNKVENFMNSDRDDFRRNHSGRIGIDYEINKKTVAGILLSGFSNLYGMKAVNNSRIYLNKTLDTTIIINNPERHPLDSYSANFNIQHQLSSDRQLSVNVDYIYYRDANTLSYLNDFYKGNGSLLYSERTKSSKETPINFWVATVDHTMKIGKQIDMEAGLKTTFSHFINDVRVEREIQNRWTLDNNFTSKHNLEEIILAAYTSFNIKLGEKTNAKAGLRYEYTNSNLGSEVKKNIVDRHYGNLFPSLFVSHAINEKTSFNFSYSRRITRPTFNDMAPFVYFVDPNTVFSGNPALQPSFANAVKWDYLLKQFVFSLSYTHEKNTITNFSPRVDPITNRHTLVAENQKDKDILSVTVSLPFTITKGWTMQNNISGYWQQLNAFYKGVPLQITQRNINLNSTQSFTLPKNFTIELNGAYQSGGLFGIYKIRSTTSLNFGVQKKLGVNGGTLLFNVTDFTGVPHLRFSVDAPEHNLVTNGDVKFTATTLKLSYTKRFGKLTLKENRSRKTGSEEERQRVQ
ncbi:MAG: outer membrane beta-barrel family protein [Chitinophagaceae bacterium]